MPAPDTLILHVLHDAPAHARVRAWLREGRHVTPLVWARLTWQGAGAARAVRSVDTLSLDRELRTFDAPAWTVTDTGRCVAAGPLRALDGTVDAPGQVRVYTLVCNAEALNAQHLRDLRLN